MENEPAPEHERPSAYVLNRSIRASAEVAFGTVLMQTL